jgi:hypothetical protein
VTEESTDTPDALIELFCQALVSRGADIASISGATPPPATILRMPTCPS